MKNEIKIRAQLLSIDDDVAYVKIGDKLLEIKRDLIIPGDDIDVDFALETLMAGVQDIYAVAMRVQSKLGATREGYDLLVEAAARARATRAASVRDQRIASAAGQSQPETDPTPAKGIIPDQRNPDLPAPPDLRAPPVEEPELLPVCLVNEETIGHQDGMDIELVDFKVIAEALAADPGSLDMYAKTLSEYTLSSRMKKRSEMSIDLRRAIVSYCKMRDGSKTMFTPADEAEFLDSSDMSVESSFGVRISSSVAKIPENFEESSVAGVLRGQRIRQKGDFRLPKK